MYEKSHDVTYPWCCDNDHMTPEAKKEMSRHLFDVAVAATKRLEEEEKRVGKEIE